MSGSGALGYCLDTSSLIAAWDERYPLEHFPRFWDHMDGALDAGRAIVHESVVDELMKRSTDLAKWLKRLPHSIVPFETDIQIKSREILSRHPRLVMAHKTAFAADPFVIATAALRGVKVVSEEGFGSAGKPKIPDVCQAEGPKCIRLLDLIRENSWVI